LGIEEEKTLAGKKKERKPSEHGSEKECLMLRISERGCCHRTLEDVEKEGMWGRK